MEQALSSSSSRLSPSAKQRGFCLIWIDLQPDGFDPQLCLSQTLEEEGNGTVGQG